MSSLFNAKIFLVLLLSSYLLAKRYPALRWLILLAIDDRLVLTEYGLSRK